MRRFITVIFLFCIAFYGCELPPEEEKTAFSISSPSWLYFNNLRSIYYGVQSDKANQLDYYTLKKWESRSEEYAVIPIIVKNWLKEEAYIELNFKGLSDDAFELTLDGTAESIELPLNRKQQFELAIKLDSLLLNDKQITINDSIDLFTDRYEKTYFLTTTRDYLKLFE